LFRVDTKTSVYGTIIIGSKKKMSNGVTRKIGGLGRGEKKKRGRKKLCLKEKFRSRA
jgi:hypothetical protein